MKKTIHLLLIILAVPIVSAVQENTDISQVTQTPPVWQEEYTKAALSDYVDAFAEAFTDPNVLIGVFEIPQNIPNMPALTTLSSGEVLETLPGYREFRSTINLRQLKCIRTIKGEFTEPIVFVIRPPLFRKVRMDGNPIPTFVPHTGTQWVLALQKTNPEYRVARVGEKVKDYEFLNNQTVFTLFRWGHGALCLQWPENQKETEGLVKVTKNIVDDLEAIEQTIPRIQKTQREPADAATINKTKESLKTAQAKSIFDKLLQKSNEK